MSGTEQGTKHQLPRQLQGGTGLRRSPLPLPFGGCRSGPGKAQVIREGPWMADWRVQSGRLVSSGKRKVKQRNVTAHLSEWSKSEANAKCWRGRRPPSWPAGPRTSAATLGDGLLVSSKAKQTLTIRAVPLFSADPGEVKIMATRKLARGCLQQFSL